MQTAKTLIRLGGCQADLSLRCVLRSFGWFCRMQAQILRHLNAVLHCYLSLDHKEDKAVFTNNPEASAADDILTLRKTCCCFFCLFVFVYSNVAWLKAFGGITIQ